MPTPLSALIRSGFAPVTTSSSLPTVSCLRGAALTRALICSVAVALRLFTAAGTNAVLSRLRSRSWGSADIIATLDPADGSPAGGDGGGRLFGRGGKDDAGGGAVGGYG